MMKNKIKLKRQTPTACFSGSLLQQSFGESIDKGYVVWDVDNKEYSRRFILNDYGYSKIRISHGESLEDRVNNMKFSHDKKKTKVHVVIQDFEENYSVEKEQQIKQLIRDKHGCESINISFEEIKKDKSGNIETHQEDYQESEFNELFLSFIKKISPNISKDELNEIIQLSNTIDTELDINQNIREIRNWNVDSMVVSNIYSFPEKPHLIDFSKYKGVLGIFGENFSGKSNLVRALIFGLFQVELGKKGRSAGNLVNIYTKSNNGYVTIQLSINDVKYKIHREVKTTIDKNGKLSNSFPVKYYKYVLNPENNTYFWKEEESDENTTENKEIKRQIVDAIGTFDEFSKISLHLQSGEGDFMKEEQQPKNDLIRKFMGLDLFDERYDYANETFKEIKKKQKDLGDFNDTSSQIKSLSVDMSLMQTNVDTLSKEMAELEANLNNLQNEKNTHAENIQKIDFVEIQSQEKIDESIVFERGQVENENNQVVEQNDWLSSNFKKEIPQEAYEDINKVESDLNRVLSAFKKEKDEYSSIESWLNSNTRHVISDDYSVLSKESSDLNKSLIEHHNQLSISRGDSCPTCGSITRQANQEMVDRYSFLINDTKNKISNIDLRVKQIFEHQKHNGQYDVNTQSLETLKMSLVNKKGEIERLRNKKTIIENSAEMLQHNREVERGTQVIANLNNSIINRNKRLVELENMKERLALNKQKGIINLKNQEAINSIDSEIYQAKISIRNMGSQINELTIEKRLTEEKFYSLNKKLDSIADAEKNYRKYSLYLQAVHRDGIPADIIRKKLPIINSKINSLLGEVVDFKVEIVVNKNGDLMEYFYFNEDKSDMLPVYAFSGSQGFLSALAVKVALQYASNFVKPSLLIIDEGFGTLDKNIIHEFPRILDYLRPKFKNILITTHISEVKDFVDHIVEISKTRVGVTKDGFDKHPKAWVSHVSLS